MGINLAREIVETWKLFSLVKIKLSISILAFVFAKLAVVGGF